jgi:ABC-type dipeptide/oligopeptide/nickel transport system ATPase component
MLLIYIIGFFLLFVIIYYLTSNTKSLSINTIITEWKNPKLNTYFDFDNLSNYFYYKSKNAQEKTISDEVVNDLDLDDVFMFLDRTSSKIGQQYLYYRLRSINNDNLSALIDLFVKNEKIRLETQLELKKLDSPNGYDFEKLLNNQFIKPKFEKYYLILLIILILAFLLSFIAKYFILLIIPVFFINSILHYKNKKYTTFFFNGLKQMITAYKVSKQILKIKEINNNYQKNDFIQPIKKLTKRTRFIIVGEALNNPSAIVFWLLFEVVKILFNLEGIVFYSLFNDINKHKNNLEDLFVFIGKIDTAISVSSIIIHNQTCKPKFVDDKKLEVKSVYHPLVPNCVRNDITLHHNSLLLTGSNMSGKTTFIRTIAINNILAQTLNFCFADEFISLKFNVLSSIRITDDLFNSKSYYLQEVLRIKELIAASNINKPYLFILDEIFRGTNTTERIAASKAVLSYLNRNNHMVLVSTHDIELVELLSDDNYELFHFSEKIEGNQLSFDYQIKKGHLRLKNAIKILELYDYPSVIISEANRIADK